MQRILKTIRWSDWIFIKLRTFTRHQTDRRRAGGISFNIKRAGIRFYINFFEHVWNLIAYSTWLVTPAHAMFFYPLLVLSSPSQTGEFSFFHKPHFSIIMSPMLNRRDTYVGILTFKYRYFIFRISIKSNDVTLVKKKRF